MTRSLRTYNRLFLDVLRDTGIQFGTDDDAILKAQAVCVGLAQGTSLPEILEAVDGSPAMTSGDAVFLFGAAGEAYCPELNPAG